MDLSSSIIIVGGGIGGVTAALALAKLGHEVQVFEQAAKLGEAGAGIQLGPNCTRVLHHLGLEAALKAVAFVPEGGEMRHWKSGKLLSASPLAETALQRYGFPYFHVHRADLMELLVQAATTDPRIEINNNSPVESVNHNTHGVSVRVHGQDHHGAVLIGADGIHSVTRNILFGPEPATFTGNVAWRMLVPAGRLPEGLIRPMATAWWGPKKHFVHYYVRTGELVNCVCVVEKAGWEVESWSEPGDHTSLARDFVGWHSDVQSLIANADPESCYKWALFDRPPMPRWSDGRATLLGDACHPTLPFMAQGAAMAIEDGAVLAHCIGEVGNTQIAPALRRYENLRRDRTAAIQAGSRRNARIFHLSGIAAWLRNVVADPMAKRTMEKVFGYDALSVSESS